MHVRYGIYSERFRMHMSSLAGHWQACLAHVNACSLFRQAATDKLQEKGAALPPKLYDMPNTVEYC